MQQVTGVQNNSFDFHYYEKRLIGLEQHENEWMKNVLMIPLTESLICACPSDDYSFYAIE